LALGEGPHTPIPNPQSPIPNPHAKQLNIYLIINKLNNKNIKKNYI
jgi:hypothetical protein